LIHHGEDQEQHRDTDDPRCADELDALTGVGDNGRDDCHHAEGGGSKALVDRNQDPGGQQAR
jgi:hypothetical protein